MSVVYICIPKILQLQVMVFRQYHRVNGDVDAAGRPGLGGLDSLNQ